MRAFADAVIASPVGQQIEAASAALHAAKR